MLCAPFFSCSSEEEDTTKDFLSGDMSLDPSQFALVGDTLTFHPKGVSQPDDEGALGLYFTISSLHTSLDTVYRPDVNPFPVKGATIGYRFSKDTLGTFTLTATAYSRDSDLYYTTAGSTTITLVNENKSILPRIGYVSFDAGITDPRDGEGYNYVEIGSTKWLKQNLHYKGTEDSPVGIPFYKAEVMNKIFGRYYTYEEALTACPEGWTLPSSADFDALGEDVGAMMVDATFNTVQMWEFWPGVDIKNTLKLGIIPVGYADAAGAEFKGYGSYAAFWTSDEASASQAYGRYIHEEQNLLMKSPFDKKNTALSVRCIKK